MKALKSFFTYFVPLLVGLLVGLSIFFPWQDVFELLFLKSSSSAVRNGVEIQADSFDKEGLLPSFSINGMSIKSFLGGASFSEVRVIPQVMSSVAKKSIVVKIELDSGKVELPAMVDKSLSGSFLAVWKPGTLQLNMIKINGDISASGIISVNLKNRKILAADVSIRVPDEMNMPMNTLKKMLPLKKKPDGSWLLNRKGHKK